MRVLAISSAYAGCSVAFVQDGEVLAESSVQEPLGLAAALPVLVQAVLTRSGPPDIVAVVVGPGSFTGLRAGISVAAGVGLGFGVEVVGVSVTEALAAGIGDPGGRELWVATAARRGRVFIDAGSGAVGFATDALPHPRGSIIIAGNAANEVAAALAAKGVNVKLMSARVPLAARVAAVGVARACGALPPLAALPLYVDAPEAKLPAGGLRAPPA